jgi:hypothetical protein
VLPAAFGSLYTLGYNPIQILVIGAYIVTTYFMFVERNPEQNRQDVYGVIERVLGQVLEENDHEHNSSAGGALLNDILNNEDFEMETKFGGNNLKLLSLLDNRSAAFIQKFDSAMTELYPEIQISDKKSLSDRVCSTNFAFLPCFKWFKLF